MNATRNTVAGALDILASQEAWNSALWLSCFNLARAGCDAELIEFIRHELIRHDDLFPPRTVFGAVSPPLINAQGSRHGTKRRGAIF